MKLLKLLAAFSYTILLGGCITPKPPAYSNIDDFQNELANKAQESMGKSDDFKIVVTQASFPIGTLIRVGSTIPVDYKGCLPFDTPPMYSTPSLFPVYSLSKNLAVDFGLDNEAIKKLVDFGVTIKDSDQVTLSVKSPQLQVLADTDIKKILSKDDCMKAISASSVWLVRGYVFGQRNFLLKSENASKVKGHVTKIASFDIDVGSGNESVSIEDDSEVGFLQVVSQITLPKAVVADIAKGATEGAPPGATAGAAAEGAATSPVLAGGGWHGNIKDKLEAIEATVEKPKLANMIGRVYVQRDKQDKSKRGESIVTALQKASFNVERNIEQVDSSRMPKIAQIRYFNENDKPLAITALTALQSIFPTAVLVRVGLPAPSGQIEVWLPKATP